MDSASWCSSMSKKSSDKDRWAITQDAAGKVGDDNPSIRRVALSRSEVKLRKLQTIVSAGLIRAELRLRAEADAEENKRIKEGHDPESDSFREWKLDRSKEATQARMQVPKSVETIMELIDLDGKTNRVDRWSEITQIMLANAGKPRDHHGDDADSGRQVAPRTKLSDSS